MPGYQINPDALRWIAGTGEERPMDRTRLLDAGEIPPQVNDYFVECYRRFVDLKAVLEAREHTAQVTAEDRQEREERFRTADLPLLFCSPTMELGVDIAQLNVVNLRNVPPTPANYAQRSGRAGRGGQPALVYTYCAGRSPHDQYYFRQPEDDGGRLGGCRRGSICATAIWCDRTSTRSGWKSRSRTSARHSPPSSIFTAKTAGSRCLSKTPIKRSWRTRSIGLPRFAKANELDREHS